MGVWGTGIFDDDTACDVRAHYTDCLGEGRAGPHATRWILKQYEDLLDDPGEAGVIWLALAAVQWKHGRLEAETLERALHVIDSGSDLARWNESEDLKARRAVLEKLRKQIISSQPAETKVERRMLAECHLKRGDLLAYRLKSGARIIFRVIDRHTDRGGTYPVCEILDWIGYEVPAKTDLRELPIRRSNRPNYKHTITELMICRVDENSPRIEKLDFRLKPAQKGAGATVILWEGLDKFLTEWFLLD